MKTQDNEQQASHTPGPWKIQLVDLKPEKNSANVIIEATGYCDIFGGPTSFWALKGRTYNEAMANAQLIAAAPETAKERDELKAAVERLKKQLAVTQDDLHMCKSNKHVLFIAAQERDELSAKLTECKSELKICTDDWRFEMQSAVTAYKERDELKAINAGLVALLNKTISVFNSDLPVIQEINSYLKNLK